MPAYFPDVPPDPKLSVEEKRRIARRFRRRANLTDGCLLLGVALFLLGLILHDKVSAANFLSGICLLPLLAFVIGCLSTYYRCPACGNHIVHGEYGRYLRPFAWRGYECPVCYFSPDWSR